ncbi:MAG: hypothetical protein ACOC93_05355, partial [Planctomycetota bacterium]
MQIVFALALACCVGVAAAAPASQPATQPTSQPAHGLFTISEETTYLIEPLTDDGRVDYLAAVDRRISRGVTPENNAAIPLLRATGPDFAPDSELAQNVYPKLGIDPLPQEADGYFVELYDFMEKKVQQPDSEAAKAERQREEEIQTLLDKEDLTEEEFARVRELSTAPSPASQTHDRA